MLAQAGVPFTTGFVAKFGVIWAAVESQSYAIALVALISAVIAAFVYLRIMVTVWLSDDGAASAMTGIEFDDELAARPVEVPVSAGLGIAVAAGFTVVFGIIPMGLVQAALAVTNYA
ncbi:proton-conducting transporter membrane subunit, partial [Arthrospira platensis SPKY2]